MIRVKRAYDPADAEDGLRYLVDRLWPRGVSKEDLQIEQWLKEAAPSGDLRQWFGHDPVRWSAFKQRYFAELDGKPAALEPLHQAVVSGTVTLIYGAKDTEHNNAVALKEYLER
jgi:uncharacterized protein YeaO (DUF488 family)